MGFEVILTGFDLQRCRFPGFAGAQSLIVIGTTWYHCQAILGGYRCVTNRFFNVLKFVSLPDIKFNQIYM